QPLLRPRSHLARRRASASRRQRLVPRRFVRGGVADRGRARVLAHPGHERRPEARGVRRVGRRAAYALERARRRRVRQPAVDPAVRTWKELTAVALEGTAKSATGAEAERRLLNEAGWHMLRQLAGRRPAKFAVADERQAPEEARPLVSRAAALRLEEILRTDDREHVDEWLELAAAAGKRVPPSLLPPLLEQAAVRSDLRAPTLPVGGGRVSWLAHQNEEWAFADIADPLEAFHSGVRAARVAALAELRSHDPAAALATLAEGWQKEGGDDRAALISVLAVGLGPADEGFLTMASNDGRKEVRAGARDLLARLPESALIARMIQRADACFRFRRGVLGGKLEVNPPAEG